VGRVEDELVARCRELSDQLQQAADLWDTTGPNAGPERSTGEQQRAVMMFALNGVLEFIHDLDEDPRSRLVLLSLLDALLTLELGKPDSRLSPTKRPHRIESVVAEAVRGEAAAAVMLYRNAGLSEKAACEKVLAAISRAQSDRAVLQVSSWTTVRNWARRIPDKPTKPENIAALRLSNMLNAVKNYVPGHRPHEQADWIVNKQIPFTLQQAAPTPQMD
jgi:hypothetical protein